MKEALKKLIFGKKVLVLGFGAEGQSTFNLLRNIKSYEKLAIADANTSISEKISDKTIILHLGENYLDFIDNYDIVFKSPGISLDINNFSCKITSQIEVFLQNYKEKCVGITGTKGKSTVSSLIHHVLLQNGVNAVLCGNIGIPVFDIEIDENTVIIMELSCHQLQWLSVSPHFSVLLNIYEDHLDYYKTFENYENAKRNIYRNQNSDDFIYVSDELDISDATARIVQIPRENYQNDMVLALKTSKLRGNHNLYNCEVAYNLCQKFNVSREKFLNSLIFFETLHHRLELLGTIDQVEFYDDSISTTVESTICAISSFENLGTVIIGGLDRGIDYSQLIIFLENSSVENIILMYQTGRKIAESLKKKHFLVDDLASATDLAKRVTKANTACIMSPGAASYDSFKNFAERGDFFKTRLGL